MQTGIQSVSFLQTFLQHIHYPALVFHSHHQVDSFHFSKSMCLHLRITPHDHNKSPWVFLDDLMDGLPRLVVGRLRYSAGVNDADVCQYEGFVQ